MHETDPAIRSLRGRIGALTLHSSRDQREHLATARAAFRARFEREADPEGTLDPVERARRAELLRRLHYTRLAYASAKAKAARRRAKRPALPAPELQAPEEAGDGR